MKFPWRKTAEAEQAANNQRAAMCTQLHDDLREYLLATLPDNMLTIDLITMLGFAGIEVAHELGMDRDKWIEHMGELWGITEGSLDTAREARSC